MDLDFKSAKNRLEAEEGLIALIAHEYPDGDAVGSALGMARFLERRGKKVQVVCKTPVPERYDFLPGVGDFVDRVPGATGLSVIVDAVDPHRAGVEWEGPFMRIDHHREGITNEVSLVDPTAPSTGSILLDFFRFWDEAGVDQKVAVCLYTAILTDTNCFTIRTSPSLLRDAAWLLERGVDGHRVADLIYRRRSPGSLRLLARALASLRIEEEGAFAWVLVRKEDLRIADARAHETESLVDYPFSVDGVLIAAKLQEEKGRWRVSLRSRAKSSAERVAKELGGGGHIHAAGAVVPGSLDEALARLRAAVKKELGR